MFATFHRSIVFMVIAKHIKFVIRMMSFMAMLESSVSCNMVSEQCECESRARSSVKHCFSVIETSSLKSSIREKEEVRGSDKLKSLLEQPCLELKVE